MPRRGRARGQSDRLHHRQPKRQERGKGGARIDPHGFDGGKLIKGKKRHVLVDTLGLLLHALVTSADVQDRDGGIMVLSTLFGQSRSSRSCLPTAPMPGRCFMTVWRTPCRSSPLRSSAVAIRPKASSCCPNGGLSNAPSAGSGAVADSPRTGKTSTIPRSPSSASPPSA